MHFFLKKLFSICLFFAATHCMNCKLQIKSVFKVLNRNIYRQLLITYSRVFIKWQNILVKIIIIVIFLYEIRNKRFHTRNRNSLDRTIISIGPKSSTEHRRSYCSLTMRCSWKGFYAKMEKQKKERIYKWYQPANANDQLWTKRGSSQSSEAWLNCHQRK